MQRQGLGNGSITTEDRRIERGREKVLNRKGFGDLFVLLIYLDSMWLNCLLIHVLTCCDWSFLLGLGRIVIRVGSLSH